MLVDTLFVIASLILLYYGAEFLVGGASSVAIRFGVPVLVVGLTIVAYGTSAPELVVSVQSALKGNGGIAAGNVVGSNIFNICVILSVAALFKPVRAHLKVLRVDTPLMVATSILGLYVLSDFFVSRPEAVILLLLAIGYTIFSYRGSKKEPSAPIEPVHVSNADEPTNSLGLMILKIVGGIVLLAGGSQLLVMGSVGLAQALGISEAVIGLTIVSAGTSMPELATSVVAARKGQSDIALGNVIGSNLFNILFILGAAATIQPFEAMGITWIDLGMMIGVSVLILPFIWSGKTLNRLEAGCLLAVYAGYLWFLWPQ